MSEPIYENDIWGTGVFKRNRSTKYPVNPDWSSGYLQANLNNTEVMWQMDPAKIPIKMMLAREFAVFDDWHQSFPGPSTPNHLFAQSATSNGCTETGATYQCIPGKLFPQKTIYENLAENNKTW